MNDAKLPVSQRWCILRTTGPRTLPLARSLTDGGFEVWTPTAPKLSERAGVDRVEQPIAPTFVFAKAQHTIDLLAVSRDPASRHPSFSVFRRLNRVPFIGPAGMAGLRDAQATAEAEFVALTEKQTREEMRRERVAQLQRDRARRKALRSQPLGALGLGTWVEVQEMPALVGLQGEIVEERGTAAVVAFGGLLRMEIEAWRMIAVDVSGNVTCTA